MRVFVTGGSGFIGTNAMEAFLSGDDTVLNYSLHPPLNRDQRPYWQQGDILDAANLRKAMQEFQPEAVLHLAARADCDEKTTVETGYRVNTEGTRNVLDAIRDTPSVQRSIITSTQFVCAAGRLPTSDTDYYPETVYGQSKVVTERLTRQAPLKSCWTIIRPTNVWGPWHMRYRREFWRILKNGIYVHPGRQLVVRSYGYVKNVVYQIRKIFDLPHELVNRRTFYVGDRPINLLDWVDGFSNALTGHQARVVPRNLMRGLALLGDIPTILSGKPFFINSSRFQSMITQYDTPMEPTFSLLGESPYSQAEGIRETTDWLAKFNSADRAGGGA